MVNDSEQDIMNLVDLQRFLAEELTDSVDITTDFSKSFTPLTNGLGLQAGRSKPVDPLQRFPADLPKAWADIKESQHKPDFSDEFLPDAPPAAVPAQSVRPKNIVRVVDEAVSGFDDDTSQAAFPARKVSHGKLKTALGDLDEDAQALPQLDRANPSTPPPLPTPGVLRRLMAGIMDQVFVWTVAFVVILFISKLFALEGVLSAKQLREVARPEVVGYVLVGFSTIWFGYLVLSMGLLESTFGMWIWGMRIEYGTEQVFLKKFARIALSFFIQAPLISGICLVFQRGGKNLIDSLSGTQVYRTLR